LILIIKELLLSSKTLKINSIFVGMEPTLEKILDKSDIHPLRAKAVYIFGSRVYGTDNWESDWDIKLIANGTVSNLEIRRGVYNIHIITPTDFQNLLYDHQPGALECYFSPDFAKIYENHKWEFELNPKALRHHYSRASSSSWVKAKRKLEYDEYYSAIKSLFHSMRIPLFGIQIAKYGEIKDFSCANHIWDEISSKNWNWIEIVERFMPLRDEILVELRKATII